MIENYPKLFEHIFKNEILEYSIWITWHTGKEKSVKWKDLETKQIVEKNEKLSAYIDELLDMAISYADDTGGSYGLKTTKKSGNYGFLIWSGFTTDMIDGMDPEGCVDSKVFYLDEFIKKLSSYSLFKSINKENLSEFINFEIGEGYISYLKLFDTNKNKWVDYDQSEIGEEIETLIFDLFYNHIYSKDEFNVINDRIEFSDKSVTFYTEEQTVLQNNEFIPITSIHEDFGLIG